MLDNELLSLTEALTSWLYFENECGRHEAFEEKYLISPIFQLLDRRYHGRVRTEVLHPAGSNGGTLDFAVVSLEPEKWEIAIETKWLGNSPRSKDSLSKIVRDLLRLEFISRRFGCEHSWFLLGGPTKLFVDLWYECKQGGAFDHYRLAACLLLPHAKSRIGLDLGKRPDGKPESKAAQTVRELIRDVSTKNFAGKEIGRNFDILPENPFPQCSGDNPENFPYCLPRHPYAVYGWRIGAAKSVFRPEQEFASV